MATVHRKSINAAGRAASVLPPSAAAGTAGIWCLEARAAAAFLLAGPGSRASAAAGEGRKAENAEHLAATGFLCQVRCNQCAAVAAEACAALLLPPSILCASQEAVPRKAGRSQLLVSFASPASYRGLLSLLPCLITAGANPRETVIDDETPCIAPPCAAGPSQAVIEVSCATPWGPRLYSPLWLYVFGCQHST